MDEPAVVTRRPPGLQTVDRALVALLAFQRRSTWGVTELAQKLGVDKSVAQRLLATLAGRGFVMADPETRRYRLGPAPALLARASERGDGFEVLARPILADLAHRLDESALLSVPHGASSRCAAAVDAHGPIRYGAIVGETMPAHGGAAAHAIFAHSAEDDVRRLLGPGPYPRHSEETVTDIDTLLTTYREVRAAGVAVSTGEWDPGVTCVAAPGHLGDQVVASIGVIGPRERMQPKLERCREVVLEAGAALTALIQGGHR